MTLPSHAELQDLVHQWREDASTEIWPVKSSVGYPRNFAQCGPSSFYCLRRLYMDQGIEGNQGVGSLWFDNPNVLDIPTHYWGETVASDLAEVVIMDITPDQTGGDLPWVCDTKAHLAARGLHYATHDAIPFLELEPPPHFR